MKRFAFAFVLAATFASHMANAQVDQMVDACGRLTQELNVAQAQRVDIEARVQSAQSVGDLTMANADLAYIDAMIKDIKTEMDKVCM